MDQHHFYNQSDILSDDQYLLDSVDSGGQEIYIKSRRKKKIIPLRWNNATYLISKSSNSNLRMGQDATYHHLSEKEIPRWNNVQIIRR